MFFAAHDDHLQKNNRKARFWIHNPQYYLLWMHLGLCKNNHAEDLVEFPVFQIEHTFYLDKLT